MLHADRQTIQDFTDKQYDKLIEEGKGLTGSERYSKFYEAEKILAESYTYMPISYEADVTLVNNDKITDWEWAVNRFAVICIC